MTHDQAEALSLSDRIAVMNEGKLVQFGTPGEVYYRPKTPFVASFVGTVNLIDGVVTETSAGAEGVSVIKILAGNSFIVAEEDGEDPRQLRTWGKGDALHSAGNGPSRRPLGHGWGELLPRQGDELHPSRGANIRYWIEWQERDLIVDVFDPGEGDLLGKEVCFQLKPERIHILN